MNAVTSLSRRNFMKAGALVGGGLVIGFVVPIGKRMALAAAGSTLVPNAYLRIGADDAVTVLLSHVEMGQSIWTSLAMLIAEELDADWSKIAAVHAPAAPVYFHTIYGMQRTGGSTSLLSEFDRYRQAGATARMLLVQAAANRFGVPASQVRTENGVVIAGTHRVRYGALVVEAAQLPTPDAESVKLKEAKDWKVIGKPVKRLDSPAKVDGSAKYGLDVQFDGLLTAVVARPPTFGGKVKSFDASQAKAIRGVHDVVQVPSGVAVVADHFWAAKKGRDALKVEWDPGTSASLDSAKLREEYHQLATTRGKVASAKGDIGAGLANAARTIDVEYAVPFIAHAPMEPVNCAVRITPGKCEIWTGTQTQTADQAAAAAILGLAPEKVELTTMFLGGSFGRRNVLRSDFVREAVEVAKAAGKPVKTMWTREDDIRGGYYRPAFVHRVQIGLAEDGRPVAWKHTTVGQSILEDTPLESLLINGLDIFATEGIANSPYLNAVPNQQIEVLSPKLSVPVENWRAVGLSQNGFIIESLIDEMAHAAGKDPADYRRALLQDSPRLLAVLDMTAAKAGWGDPLPKGRGRGIAVLPGFGSFIAMVAEASADSDGIHVHRVVCTVDCGIPINPDHIEAQIQGGIAYGLSATLHDLITFKEGHVQQSNFHDYPVLRLHEMPRVETYIVPSTEKPGGLGELGTALIPAAVGNAVFAATGHRLRELPLKLPS